MLNEDLPVKRLVIAGCRDYNNYREAKEFIDFCISRIRQEYRIIIVSGGCRGADALGERYAGENGLQVEIYPADWEKYGKAAGPIRNKQMIEASDLAIAFWDMKSRGTRSLISYAKQLGKEIRIKDISQGDSSDMLPY